MCRTPHRDEIRERAEHEPQDQGPSPDHGAPRRAVTDTGRHHSNPEPEHRDSADECDERSGRRYPRVRGGQIELHRGLPIFRPSLFIEGDLWEVTNLISIMNGTVVANVVPLDPEWTRVRLVFPDALMLGFDRLAVQGSDVQFGLWIPEPVFYAYPQLSWGSRTVTIQPTDARLALPIAALSTSGGLTGSPLIVQSSSFLGPNALMASTNQDFLFLVQRH